MNLENTRVALSKLGYSTDGIEYMIQEICVVLAKYSSPVEAAKLLEATLPSCGLSRFGENAFRRFLKDIDSRNRPCINLNPLTPEQMKAMEWDEIEAHKKLLTSPPNDFDILAQPWTYDALCAHHFRESKKDEVNPKHLPTARFISVPMGGKRRK